MTKDIGCLGTELIKFRQSFFKVESALSLKSLILKNSTDFEDFPFRGGF